MLAARVVGVCPFELPDPELVVALCRSGAYGVLDVGLDASVARRALATVGAEVRGGWGVRLPEGTSLTAADLPAGVTAVVLPAGVPIAPFRPRQVVVQVTSLDEARAAVADGADAIIAKGNEAGGRIGEATTFILLQELAAELHGQIPIWAQGGIGLHTAAACIVGGAEGIVLDAQLALVEESSLPAPIKHAVRAMDGGETVVACGRRVLSRPDRAANLLPVGQDGAFARPLAERFHTAAGVVRAFLDAVAQGARRARELDPLGEGAPLAEAHGIRYPIAQGPMTRVSDRAPFADAVSRAGALPFLALSLMRGDEARALLAETARVLEGRTWGVGILGFVPPDLREEQLALIREFRPPVALIAGGRPAQAKPLEERGIATYLHVPSPGLLDLFLRDGARRFVLEGRECGGHVGPRSSFVLWESAIQRLLADPAVGEVSVLYAGGIHDGRSAAMVAAAAAPLAARGAKIGVLCGTAYLFTREAVTSGAILPGFQQAALACDRTVLLDTAPGHSTRCVDSDYVRAFEAERARLHAEGKSASEAWEALEQLNVGRLRIAAKGLCRSGAELVSVDEDVQRRDGMYMLGQVAALRRETVSMAELHAEISAGSTRELRAAGPAAAEPARPAPLEVAIVGMAGIFPGAPDLPAFWANILRGKNAITEVPPERWNVALYYDPKGTGDKTPSKWGGFLPDVPFEPGVYGIPPRSLAAIEPVQLLSLEVARRALDDAGYADRPFDRDRASVIFGAEAGTDLSGAYGFRAGHRQYLGEMPAELDRHLPKLTEDSFPGVLANVIAGRIANRLDLGGSNYTVDAACASSLAAVDIACKELSSGTSELVICGGADLHNGLNDYLMFASVHALSPTGQCRPFDAAADGIALGEGVAALVLKRLADAERDGDRIYAVIRGVGASSDGKSLGLTAPRKEGQKRALDRAYARAGFSPAAVGLVEAHGTGTVVGDKTELATLSETFAAAGARPGACTLGSVKSQIGHTKCAAGLAGLIKTALAVHNRVLPPTSNIQSPNSAYDRATSPFVFRDAAHPWPARERRAAVSAFGFGGTNFHAVIEGHGEAPAAGMEEWPAELFVLRGATREAAEAAGAALSALCDAGHRLRDLARSAAAADGPVQIAFVAESLDDLRDKVAAARGLARSSGGVFLADVSDDIRDGALALLFPGQGSQRPGMLADLFVAFPALQEILARGERWLPIMFPSAAFTPVERSAQRAAITDTRVAQPALGLCDLAAARLLARCGIRGAMLAGHSYGELAALTVAGALREEDLPALSEGRALDILDAARGAPGTMAAVKAGAAEVTAALGQDAGVVLANLNAPDQTVIAGSDAAVDAAVARLGERGLSARRIPVACAFHSPIVAGAAEAFRRRLDGVVVAAPNVPVFSNTTGETYPEDADAIRTRLGEQIGRTVRFADEIEAMYAAGARVFVEAGPGTVLSDLVGRILGDRPHVAVPIDRSGEPGLKTFLGALARLVTAGVPVDLPPLFVGRGARAFDLASPPRVGPSKAAWMVNGQMARPLVGELPDFAMRPLMNPIVVEKRIAEPPRDAVMLEYLHAMRELAEAQRQVLLRYLGEGVVDAMVLPAALALPALPAPSGKNGHQKNGASHAEPPAAAEAVKRSPLEVLVGVVSERTGYPVEMLDPDLDMEADLGIDSIKRIEILGTLSERLGLAAAEEADRSAMIEELAGVKTMRGIAAWLDRRGSATSPSPSPSTLTLTSTSTETTTSTTATDEALGRFVLALEPLAAAVPGAEGVAGRSFAITDDGRGIAGALAGLLGCRGAEARVVAVGERVGKVDGLIHLAALAESPADGQSKVMFDLAKDAVADGAAWVLAATAMGGAFGLSHAAHSGRLACFGVGGLLKSIAKEHPTLRVRAVDLDPTAAPGELAELLLSELLAGNGPVEVGYVGGARHAVRVVPARLDESPLAPLALDELLGEDSVVLITGGARGITARVAVALAQRFRCRLELVGRSPLPGPEGETPEVAACADADALRRVLVAQGGGRTPRQIDAAIAAILAGRELRATLAAIEAAGAAVAYHAVDVRDRATFGALIDEVYARHGRIDGVLHGAGVIEDKLLRDKTRDSFDRVFDTKVSGALTLAEKLRRDVKFIVFFSSVSGAFGNRGQSDYAAANDALDKLALHLDRMLPGRVLSINWGPWGGTGMISPELEREYTRRGIGLIHPEEGVTQLLDELRRPGLAQVILMRAAPASMVG